MYQGNWTCSICGGPITELPFEPRSASGLTCRTCYAKQKDKEKQQAPVEDMPVTDAPPDMPPDEAGLASEPAPADDFGGAPSAPAGEKPKFTGEWTCATCGGTITSLPFSPRDTSNLKCLDCFKKSKG